MCWMKTEQKLSSSNHLRQQLMVTYSVRRRISSFWSVLSANDEMTVWANDSMSEWDFQQNDVDALKFHRWVHTCSSLCENHVFDIMGFFFKLNHPECAKTFLRNDRFDVCVHKMKYGLTTRRRFVKKTDHSITPLDTDLCNLNHDVQRTGMKMHQTKRPCQLCRRCYGISCASVVGIELKLVWHIVTQWTETRSMIESWMTTLSHF